MTRSLDANMKWHAMRRKVRWSLDVDELHLVGDALPGAARAHPAVRPAGRAGARPVDIIDNIDR